MTELSQQSQTEGLKRSTAVPRMTVTSARVPVLFTSPVAVRSGHCFQYASWFVDVYCFVIFPSDR